MRGLRMASGFGAALLVSSVAAPAAAQSDPEVWVTGSGIVDEDAAQASFQIHRENTDTGFQVSFAVEQEGGDVIDGNPPTSINFAQGGDLAKTVSVALDDDNLEEPDTLLILAIGSGTGYTVRASQGKATVTVRDNEEPPEMMLAISPGTIEEGQMTVVDLTVSIVGATRFAAGQTIRLTMSGTASRVASGDATSVEEGNSDYLLFGVPETEGATADILLAARVSQVGVAVFVNDDMLYEGDETVDVSAEHVVDGQVAADIGTAGLTIEDNDDPPVATIAAATSTAVEGCAASSLVFTVSLDAASGRDTEILYSLSGSADNGVDYEDSNGGRVVIPKGRTSENIVLLVASDSIDEGEGGETVEIALTGASGGHATIGSQNSASGAIAEGESDPPPDSPPGGPPEQDEPPESAGIPVISVDSPVVSEESSALLVFAVTLDRHSDRRVTVDYRVSALDAAAIAARATSAGARNASPRSGTLVFEPGETRKEVSVEAPDDDVAAGDRTVTLLLANPTGARLSTELAEAGGVAVGVVLDDETERENAKAAALTHALAGIGRAAAASVVDRIWRRADAHRAGDDGPSASMGGHALSPATLAAADAEAAGRFDAAGRRALLTNGSDPARGGRFALSSARASGGGAFTVWGWGGHASFHSELDQGPLSDIEVESGTRAGHLGFDFRVGSELLVGLAASRARSEVDYEYAASSRGAGAFSAELAGIWPYAHYLFNGGVGIWAMAGAGSGAVTVGEPGAAGPEADISLRMVAIGSRSAVRPAGGSGVSLKGDILLARVSADALEGSVPMRKTETESARARFAVESATRRSLSGGGELAGVYELGARLDAGDAEEGLGADVVAELRHSSPATGLELSVRTGALVFHQQDGFIEWDFGAGVNYRPGARGRGFSVSLSPRWGSPVNGGGFSGRSGGLRRSIVAEANRGAHMKARFGYGAGVLREQALMRFYGEIEGDGWDDSRIRLGAELPPSDLGRFALDVYGERREGGGRPDHAVMLEVGFGF